MLTVHQNCMTVFDYLLGIKNNQFLRTTHAFSVYRNSSNTKKYSSNIRKHLKEHVINLIKVPKSKAKMLLRAKKVGNHQN